MTIDSQWSVWCAKCCTSWCQKYPLRWYNDTVQYIISIVITAHPFTVATPSNWIEAGGTSRKNINKLLEVWWLDSGTYCWNSLNMEKSVSSLHHFIWDFTRPKLLPFLSASEDHGFAVPRIKWMEELERLSTTALMRRLFHSSRPFYEHST